ncbi:hypothetical protein FIBSPDRAFT_982026 [Athelia psychrophila]|uniref:Uncharacterized protein n=1 Tax=Athelia psychrophila TaxID=1759441 RepID=A0A166CJK7_9AGAM|nr:hypothetical protein FIBSPDRAFT_982026 [Fibularhizoctonia sp. CBS 109695]
MPSGCLPVVMPTLQFLHVCNHNERRSIKIPPIHAGALVVLSLEGRLRTGSIENSLPSLRHLILFGDRPTLDKMSRAFPAIERLTCPFLPEYNIDHVLAAIGLGSNDRDGNDGVISAGHCSELHWPRLHTIAASTSKSMLEGGMLRYRISDLQAAGHPIRKLMLPNILHAHTDAKAMAELRKVVEVKDFCLDWPTPFDWY